jgi:hypothetical protein
MLISLGFVFSFTGFSADFLILIVGYLYLSLGKVLDI